MSNYHKPRTFRSLHGCCICRAKSSSSRFTDSEKYEADFYDCFSITEARSGEICNACVLLVKRWKKLPHGSNKNWAHVVDARSGPGGCRSSMKNRKSFKDDPDLVKFKKIVKRQISVNSQSSSPDLGVEQDCESEDRSSYVDSDDENSIIDTTYWSRKSVCCGVVFIGKKGELLLNADQYKPCRSHKNRNRSADITSTAGSTADSDLCSRSRTDTFSSNSSVAHVDSPAVIH